MSMLLELPVLPFLAPQFHKQADSHKIEAASISAPTERVVLSAGPAFLGHARRIIQDRTFAQDDQIEADHESRHGTPTSGGIDEDGEDEDVQSEPESTALLNSDPKEWKQQDHYAVLGLSSLRYKATPRQIKKAHHKKVLKHHPDKKASATRDANDDSFFKCIAKAYEVLSNPVKRRQYDSVDPAIDDDDFPSSKSTFKEEKDFFKAWGPVFEREARFAEEPKKAPMLGDQDSDKPHVEAFYDYWYNFTSWRSFEYDDKDTNEGSDSRDDKRYAEKKNKSERARKKKEDNVRLRTIVDLALSTDPRIKKFKRAEKEAREAKRNKPKSGTATPVLTKEEQAQKLKEEKSQKEQAEKQAATDKINAAAAKKVKEAAKKNLKRDKKAISSLVSSLNYFYAPGETVPPSAIEGYLNELDQILDALQPDQVASLKIETEKVKNDREGVKNKIAQSGKNGGVNTIKYFA